MTDLQTLEKSPKPIPDRGSFLPDIPESYAQLRKAVREVIVEGQREIEALKVQIYWKTGRLIELHLAAHPEQEGRGKKTIARLARDLQIEPSLFYRMLQFARTFPYFVTGRNNLTWSHYRALLAVRDGEVRKKLAQKALKSEWPVNRLRDEIGRRPSLKNGAESGILTLLQEPLRNQADVYRVGWLVDSLGQKVKAVDLGFHVYCELDKKSMKTLTEGMRVSWDFKKGWQKTEPKKNLYAYTANVERVVDGDTLLVQVRLAQGIRKRQYLRFRGLDAEAKNEPQGKKAQVFLESFFKKNRLIHFQSLGRDPYDRYISDIWKESVYLNQEILNRGFARRVP